MKQGVGVMTCGVREARDSFSQLRRRAAKGEEIVIVPDSAEGESEAVSLVPTWYIDELTAKAVDWRIAYLAEPDTSVPDWVFDGNTVTEAPGGSKSQVYVVEHSATGITGVGATKEAAIESLIDGLLAYNDEYYSDLPFYLSPKSGRRDHYPGPGSRRGQARGGLPLWLPECASSQ